MRKFKEIQKTAVTYELLSCTCNFFGKTVKVEDEYFYSNSTSFTITPGYELRFDGDKITFNICDQCIQNLKETSKIKPSIK